ncbi:hypothetical protein PROFUN_04937 [Planoprotostelium fungivorum]|uniref:Uncharacterized protein n=1 Tax=Planoprotostelium fungivorum TaxID=1890364 RepID=A0A2P6NSL6_9EUKA|nr:hypothetical protein PROFUN_04937 [Planoprotostelium fungivorum]
MPALAYRSRHVKTAVFIDRRSLSFPLGAYVITAPSPTATTSSDCIASAKEPLNPKHEKLSTESQVNGDDVHWTGRKKSETERRCPSASEGLDDKLERGSLECSRCAGRLALASAGLDLISHRGTHTCKNHRKVFL